MIRSRKKIYCLAPWVHAYVNTLGKRDLCCFRDFSMESEKEGSYQSFEDFWNGPLVKDARRKMLAGEVPDACYPCSSRVLYNEHPRNFFFSKYDQLEEEIFANTGEGGETVLTPKYLDYRFSNTCNFSCRMCSAGASSKIEAVEKAFRPEDYPLPSFREERGDFNDQFALKEFKRFLDNGALDQIYWGGGEPLVTREHWDLMIYAGKSELARSIDITYNTNLSVLEFMGLKLIEIIEPFKSIKMLVSLDGVGLIGEYIREGMSWEKMKSNIELMRNRPNVELKLTITITLPGLFNLDELADYILENDLDYEVHICHANGPHDLMSPLILPNEILRPLVEKAKDKLVGIGDPRLKGLISNLDILINSKTIAENFSLEFDKHFFASRKYFLRKEPREGMLLKEILVKDRDTFNWWFREEHLSLKKPSLFDSTFVEIQSEKIKKNEKYFQYSSEPQLLEELMRSSFSVDFLNNSEFSEVENIIVTNDASLIERPVQTLSYLSSRLQQGGKLLMIIPAESYMNKRANLSDLRGYQKKIWLDHFLKRSKPEGLTVVSCRPVPPWRIVLHQNFGLGQGSSLGKVFNWIQGVLNINACLHRQWVLKKD